MANYWRERGAFESYLLPSAIRDKMLSLNNTTILDSLDGGILSATPSDNKVYYAQHTSLHIYPETADQEDRYTPYYNFFNPSEVYFVLRPIKKRTFSYTYTINNSCLHNGAKGVKPENGDVVVDVPGFFYAASANQRHTPGALVLDRSTHEIIGIATPYINALCSASGFYDTTSEYMDFTAVDVVVCPFVQIWQIGEHRPKTAQVAPINPPIPFGETGYYYSDISYTQSECFLVGHEPGWSTGHLSGAYSAKANVLPASSFDSSTITSDNIDAVAIYSLYPSVLIADTPEELEELRKKSNKELDEIAVTYTSSPDSPYTPGTGGGRPSSTGGGGGSFNTDPGAAQEIPIGAAGVNVASTGMFNMYAPTLSEIQNFGGWLWSENFNLDSFKRLFTDPVSSILSFNRSPFSLDSIVPTAAAEIHFANLSSGIQSARLTNSNGQINWGSVDIVEYWGGAMDYAPYTKISLYLPWGTGFVDLKISDVMKGSINIKSNVDVLSGDCLHMIIDGHGRVIGQHRGNIYQDIPFSGGGGFLRAVGSGLMGGAVTALTGGAGAVASVGLETARSVAGADYTPTRGGGVGAAGALMGVQYPYIIIDRPVQSIPASFGASRGYPSNITSKLSMLTGYTEIKSVHLENIPATDAELSEIESLLKSGVIL